MTVRAARTLRALLLTVAVVLSVLAHHELMSGTGVGSGSVMVMSAAGSEQRQVAAPQVMSCGNGAVMCTAAGVAHAPAPAGVPTAALTVELAPSRASMHPLPPGTGPPEPGGGSSVLRI